MTTQRAVVNSLIMGVVQVKNMLTCDVVPSGGDTAQVLWDAYLHSIWTPLNTVLATAVASADYEIQNRSAGKWVTYDLIPFVNSGTVGGDFLPNAVAAVLIGKAAGSRHVGRKFFSNIPEASATGNSLSTAALVGMAAVLLAYITPFTGLGGGVITPGILDKTETFRPFVGGFISSLLGSMRRRKPGVGI